MGMCPSPNQNPLVLVGTRKQCYEFLTAFEQHWPSWNPRSALPRRALLFWYVFYTRSSPCSPAPPFSIPHGVKPRFKKPRGNLRADTCGTEPSPARCATAAVGHGWQLHRPPAPGAAFNVTGGILLALPTVAGSPEGKKKMDLTHW